MAVSRTKGSRVLSRTRLCSLLHVVAERDAFDTLFDHAPDKLNLVKKVTPPSMPRFPSLPFVGPV